MNKKFLACVSIAILLVLLLSACDRPASVAPTGNTTPTGEIPFPLPAKPTFSAQDMATQTAIAKNPPVVVVSATPAKGTIPAGQPTAAVKTTALPPVATNVPIVVPSATPGRPATYTIQFGDHYICLARRYNLNIGEFLSVNGLTLNTQAVIGNTVKIPQGGSWSEVENGPRALKSHPDTHIVASGESLNRIACTYGDVDPNAILAANGLTSADDVKAGMTLQIP